MRTLEHLRALARADWDSGIIIIHRGQVSGKPVGVIFIALITSADEPTHGNQKVWIILG